MIYDISPEISERLAVWPGDTPLERQLICDMRRGERQNLSTMRGTVHLGAHADAPSHFGIDAASIAEQPLEIYMGRCRLLRVDAAKGECLQSDILPAGLDAERLLFATGTYPDPSRFSEDFAALSPELISACNELGVRLVGIDTPSVDPYGSEENAAHAACFEHDIAILEGLRLAEVPEGLYELIALPLRLAGFEASPVRAVLRSLPV
jgi:arylformamidase